LKQLLQYLLQKILGIQRYLVLHSWVKIKTLHRDDSENDFFHFLTLIPSSGVVLDIGANIGIMSYHLHKRTHKSQEVHAFEPIPYNLGALKRIKNIFNLNRLHIHNHALGNSAGEIEMILPVVNGVIKQGLSHVNHEKMTDFQEGIKVKTDCCKLDDLEWIQNKRVSAIKMDVENFEFEVLEGGIELLQRDRPIVYTELWDNENRKMCFDLMKKMGYTIKVLKKTTLEPFQSNNYDGQNFFFIPDSLSLLWNEKHN
jgi:FkbM family methyltransferase